MARLRLDLGMINVRRGDVLTYFDDPSVYCVVVEPYPAEVYYKGEVVSLSEAARRAYNSPSSVQGAGYWRFEDELLTERRRRFEKYHVDSFKAAGTGGNREPA